MCPMKSCLLSLLLCLAAGLPVRAQDPPKEDAVEEYPRKVMLDEVGKKNVLPEKMPAFKGGDLRTFRNWVQQRLKYPDEAFQKEIEGRVVVLFVVDADGSVSGVEVQKSPSPFFSEEVLRVMDKAPAWTPGKQDGKPVSVIFSMPLDFRLK